MFICSFKLNKARMLSGVAAVCLALTLVFLVMPTNSTQTGSTGDAAATNQQDMVVYLEKIGYTVAPQAILVEPIVIPQVFDAEFEQYNEMQKPAGFDLSNYKGKTAQKYTFKVLNYEDNKKEIVANLLIFENQVIGGDISSTELGGFCNGLITEKTTTEAPDQKKTE